MNSYDDYLAGYEAGRREREREDMDSMSQDDIDDVFYISIVMDNEWEWQT